MSARRPKVGALFAGYGGLDLAVEEVFGAELAWYCEVDPGAALILAHHYPDVPNYGDVTTVKWTPDCPTCGSTTTVAWTDDEPRYVCDARKCRATWDASIRFDDPDADRIPEPVDIVTGGSPCQDLSGAGRRAGMTEGTRSNLWVAMRECIARLRPARVIWENVRGAYSACADSELGRCRRCVGEDPAAGHDPRLRALGRVLGDLSDIGYDAGWHGLLAADPAVGACHPRFRVFVSAVDARAPNPPGERHERSGPAWHGRPGPADGGSGDVHVRLMPTPTRTNANGNAKNNRGELLLPGVATLFPTPVTDPASGNGHARDLATEARTVLLPTPAVNDMGEGKTVEKWDDWTADMKARHGNGNGHGKSLAIEAQRLLPGAVQPSRWGAYAAAIERWEAVMGRPAPSPTESAPKGGVRLAPAFVEWMMGLPAGWVTSPAIWEGKLRDGKTGKPLEGARLASAARVAQLKALGNGVVWQQAAHALRVMLPWEQVAA